MFVTHGGGEPLRRANLEAYVDFFRFISAVGAASTPAEYITSCFCGGANAQNSRKVIRRRYACSTDTSLSLLRLPMRVSSPSPPLMEEMGDVFARKMVSLPEPA